MGIVFSVYNISRKEPNTVKHGLIQLNMLGVYAVLLSFMYHYPALGILSFAIVEAITITRLRSLIRKEKIKDEL